MNPKDAPGDKLFADIIRAQTTDYETRFAPFEDALAGMITRTGTTNLAGDLERTRGAITGAAQNVQGMANRSAERLGIAGARWTPPTLHQRSLAVSTKQDSVILIVAYSC